jgi:hypothetical protein
MNRRDFIKYVGLFLAGTIVGGCRRPEANTARELSRDEQEAKRAIANSPYFEVVFAPDGSEILLPASTVITSPLPIEIDSFHLNGAEVMKISAFTFQCTPEDPGIAVILRPHTACYDVNVATWLLPQASSSISHEQLVFEEVQNTTTLLFLPDRPIGDSWIVVGEGRMWPNVLTFYGRKTLLAPASAYQFATISITGSNYRTQTHIPLVGIPPQGNP